MLGGRVKTLHPAVHAGILARDTSDDLKEMEVTSLVIGIFWDIKISLTKIKVKKWYVNKIPFYWFLKSLLVLSLKSWDILFTQSILVQRIWLGSICCLQFVSIHKDCQTIGLHSRQSNWKHWHWWSYFVESGCKESFESCGCLWSARLWVGH